MLTIVNSRLTVLNLLPKNSTGAEIGVFKGEYSKLIFKIAKPKKLYLVDPWVNSDKIEHKKTMYSPESSNDMERIFNNVTDFFKKNDEKNIVEIVRQYSDVFFDALENESLDFVYIDGDHNYLGVKNDLNKAMQKIKKGGLICIDDYSLGNWWGDDVVKAVNQFIGSFGVMLIYAGDNQVVVKKM